VVAAALTVGLWVVVISLTGGSDSARAGGPPLLVYSEFGAGSDIIWAADSDNPSQRDKLASVDHAPEYGIVASLSPDGERIAYTVLPPEGVAAIDAPAELWVMDRDGENRLRLATDADLPVAPIWMPDSSAVIFRRSNGSDIGSDFQLVIMTVSGEERTLVDLQAGLIPVGFTPDGTFYFVSLSTSGTDLGIVFPSGGVIQSLVHLSDDFARDWHLSPDGERLAYSAPRTSGDDVTYDTVVVDLNLFRTNLFKSLSIRSNQGDEFNPIWRPNGSGVTVGRLDTEAGDSATSVDAASVSKIIQAVPAQQQGFDVPLSWSPGASYLAVRYYETQSLTDPGRSWVTVVGNDGTRKSVSPNSDVQVMGWVDSGG
jgi:hypothetical protein